MTPPTKMTVPDFATAVPLTNPRPNAIAGVATKTVARNTALDFTKGALVLFMVLYHWLNYFHGQHGTVFRYLRFLPPSFIFITGFLVSNAYLAKYQLTDPRLPKRLVVRGLKLLGVFVFLNLAISFVFFGFRNLNATTLWAVYGTGNVAVAGSGKAAAFYILVPISYLLLLSAGLLILCRVYRHTFYLVLTLSLISIFGLSLYGLGSSNLELVSIGLMGLIVGYFPIEKINAAVRHPIPIVTLYLIYTVAITLREPNYVGQFVGVVLTLMLIYLLGISDGGPRTLRNQIVLLGKYPLFGYIAQIAILQLLYAALRKLELPMIALLLSLVAGVVLTFLAVKTVDWARSRSSMVDSLYKGVFA